ncbi:hypothetical protein HPB51_017018 [Rhipicephalus microplus]|uniref:Secreted protein n=1 Tax=Rhipicephalus microplus TaxID=6941 RepID=A0A9J6F5R0_RHIMP|nr:hypothetical protein HPB51_017018 [Rhipicephalus microplus]
MKGAVVASFVALLVLHLCGPLWPVASGIVRNRTEDLPIVFPDDDNVASDTTTLTTRTARRLPEPPFARSKGVPDSILFRMRDVRNLTDFVSQFLEGYRTYQETIQDPPPPVAPLHIAYLYEGHGNLTSFPYCLSLFLHHLFLLAPVFGTMAPGADAALPACLPTCLPTP